MAMLKKLVERLSPKEYQISYSQCGEDLIVDFILNCLKISSPSYLDIGAYHPTHLSNTYLFYQKGYRGVCIEPDPILFAEIKKVRKRDTCLNVGIGTSHVDGADFYVMTSKTLNTFSREEAERYQSYNQRLEKIVQVPLIPIRTILEQRFVSCPNFISLDVEGLDLQILRTFNFSKYRPEVFCIETLTYTEDKSEKKINEVIDLMISNDYFIYADTYINTIFVSRESWSGRSV